LTAVSAFQRRASAHFLRRPRTGKIATSVITRVYAEKAALEGIVSKRVDAPLSQRAVEGVAQVEECTERGRAA